ncbi:3-hydroxyacyl-thioester dehydratase X [Patella vulgata]|uniref:3-hydroxyacyl-thioester dehydratase X n=1 Tax=Patella vulgata TaxID=6465 RepID=UPI0021804B90|nr:3-hydroxyacyl-thioester dehydratase X [Patella vulgata]
MMVGIIAAGILSCLLLIFAATFLKLLFFQTKNEYSNGSEPSIITLIAKAVYRIATRQQGRLYLNANPERKDKRDTIKADQSERISISKYRINRDKLHLYKQVCCCEEVIPLCFLESLFMPSLVNLTVNPMFKLSPLGLIHLRQTITVHDSLERLLNAEFDLESRIKEYRLVSRGVEVDVFISVITDTGFCIWEGLVTLLSRNTSTQRSGGNKNINKQNNDREPKPDNLVLVDVPSDNGIKYARASGDWNPHHIYPWSARLLGYRKPIAHGMWILSKTISLITQDKVPQNYPLNIEAMFKRPLFMPGQAIIGYSNETKYRDVDKVDFSVADAITSAPHLIGSLIYNVD